MPSLARAVNPTESPETHAGAQAAANALRGLLGREIHGAHQQPDGSYRARTFVGVSDLAKHFRGEVTVAIEIVLRGRARFLAFDLDELGMERQAILAAELRKIGLSGGAICTSGSDAGRRKVLVFFAKSYRQSTLHDLGKQIVVAASKHPAWGFAPSHAVSIFPMLGEGGLIRLGGVNRSPSRNAIGVDAWFSLDGEPMSLADVRPLKKVVGGMIEKAPQQAWVTRYLDEPWTYARGSQVILHRVLRLAGEAYRIGGTAQGFALLRGWTDRVQANSPEMRGARPSGDTRAERTWDRWVESSWNYIGQQRLSVSAALAAEFAVSSVNSNAKVTLSMPVEPVGLDSVTPRPIGTGPRRVLEFVVAYAAEKGVTADAVALSYRAIGGHLGISEKTAWKHVQALVSAERLVIHDRGVKGPRGLATILGVVPADETPTVVLARGKSARGNVKARSEARVKYAVRGAQMKADVAAGIAPTSPVDELRARRQAKALATPPRASSDVCAQRTTADCGLGTTPLRQSPQANPTVRSRPYYPTAKAS
jgi:hypothetical protein